jgi:TRAP-type C4-dicarboxylate transport system substrate-binding protein
MPQVSERFEKELGVKVRWVENWGSSVCKLGECLEAVEAGLLDMAEVEAVFEPSKLMPHNFSVFVPFSTGSPKIAAKIYREIYETEPALTEILEEDYNQVYIGGTMLSSYGLVTTFTWDTIEDLKGRKLAAAGPNLPWVSSIGAVPVQSSLNEGYTSMQTGVYDGWTISPDGASSFKLEEVSKQYTITNFGAIHTPLLTMNRDKWESLTGDQQRIIREVADEWIEYAGKHIQKKQEQAIAHMEAKGLRIKRLTEEERSAWANMLPNIPKERIAEISQRGFMGAETVIPTYIELLKKHGVTLPRDWLAE